MNKREKSTLVAIAAMLHDIGKVMQKSESNPKRTTNPNYGDYMHVHYTDKLLEKTGISNCLGKYWKEIESKLDIIATAASHHNASTYVEKLIQKGDWNSSDLDRSELDNKHDNIKNYKNVRLSNILELISLQDKLNQPKSFYDQVSLTCSENIFPNSEDPINKESEKRYADIVKNIEDDIETVLKEFSQNNNICALAEGIDGLMFRNTSLVPASVTDDEFGVSLYDHSKLVAAFSSALYNNENVEDYLLIKGEFFGIQNFIFNKNGKNKSSAKILRGKSFYVSLLAEVTILYLLEELDLPSSSILLNSAGKFVILASNNNDYKSRIKVLKEKVNSWLYDRYYGEVSFGLYYVERKHLKNFSDIWLEFLDKSNKSKMTKFELYNRNPVHNLNTFSGERCDCCGIDIVISNNTHGYCQKCDIFRKLGEEIANADHRRLYLTEGKTFFDKYDYTFLETMEYKSSIQIDMNYKFLGGRVVPYKSYVHQDEKGVTAFNELAKDTKGILAVLKADVDDLGNIFAYGLSQQINSKFEDNSNFSRINSLSRAIHLFFSYHIQSLALNKKIYTVFSGGDDLFFIGAYNEIVEFAVEVNNEFKRYSNNPELTLSAGIGIFKANIPIWFMAEETELLLSRSKNLNKSHGQDRPPDYKNAISIFEATVNWDIFINERDRFYEVLLSSFADNYISVAFYYKLLELSGMHIKFKENMAKNSIQTDKQNIKLLMWRPRLRYMIGRLKEIRDDEIKGKLMKYVHEMITDKPELFKALIQLELYNMRCKNEQY